MADTVLVYAVPGRLYSLPGRKGDFVGYERLPPGAPGADVSIPGGASYALKPGGEPLANTVDVRRAINDGDISREPPTAPQQSAGGDAGGEV